jgi:glycosyltransferase involved in cell wall biosynthesis
VYHQPRLVDPEPNTLVFSGALTYAANSDAAEYFVSEILPLVRAKVPAAHLRITGSVGSSKARTIADRDGVTLTGYVQDIRPIVAGSRASVVPLRLGGGTRLKILEAMALGTPVVSTSKGAEGLEIVPGEHLLVADTPNGFARFTVQLLEQPQLRADLAARARRLVEQQYDWASIGRWFGQVVEEACTATAVANQPRRVAGMCL